MDGGGSSQPPVPDGVEPTDAQMAERSAEVLEHGPVTPGREVGGGEAGSGGAGEAAEEQGDDTGRAPWPVVP